MKTFIYFFAIGLVSTSLRSSAQEECAEVHRPFFVFELASENPFLVLGFPGNGAIVTERDLKVRRRQAAKILHPDRRGNDDGLKIVNATIDQLLQPGVLSDMQRKYRNYRDPSEQQGSRAQQTKASDSQFQGRTPDPQPQTPRQSSPDGDSIRRMMRDIFMRHTAHAHWENLQKLVKDGLMKEDEARRLQKVFTDALQNDD